MRLGETAEVVLGVEERDLDAGVDEGGGELEHGIDVPLPWPREHENVRRGVHHSGKRQVGQLADLMAALVVGVAWRPIYKRRGRRNKPSAIRTLQLGVRSSSSNLQQQLCTRSGRRYNTSLLVA